MKWSEDEIEYLNENYPNFGPKELSIKLKRSVDSINIKLKSLDIRGQIFKKYDKFTFDLHNKTHLYLMGFLWADGYLHNTKNRLELSINTDDFNDIADYIDTNYWAVYQRKRKNRKDQTTIGLYQEKVCDKFRIEYNYTEKSLKGPNFIDKIPESLLFYFVRGFFDGDGCFYLSKDNKQKQCYLAGTYEQDWNWIEKILKGLSIEYLIKRKVQNIKSKYSIIYIIKKDIIKFGSYIYKDNSDRIGLKRKYEKFLKF